MYDINSEDRSSEDDKLIQWTHEAIHEAQEESRRLGVPNVYGINGRVYYELPNGELTLEDPGCWDPTDYINGSFES